MSLGFRLVSIDPHRMCTPRGCYKFQFDDAKAKFIIHRFSEKAPIPDHCYIDKTFEVHDNHSDGDAKVGKAPCVFVCHEFFAAETPFRQLMIREAKPKQFLKVVGDIADQVRDEAAAQKKGVLQDRRAIVAECKGKKRQAAAARARVARSKASAEKKRPQIISV